MGTRAEELRERTEEFAVAVVKFCETLPNTLAGRKIGGQLIDSATSVGANYRATCRSYTRPLFISKLAIVAEEADESQFWLILLVKVGLTSAAAAKALIREATELTAIFTASLVTARRNQPSRKPDPPKTTRNPR